MTFSRSVIRLYLITLLLAPLVVNSSVAQDTSDLNAMQADLKLYREVASEELDSFAKQINNLWGKPTFSTRTKWIDYSKDLTKRLVIDFEKETLHFERIGSSAISDDELPRPLMAILNLTTKQAFERDTLAQAIEKRVLEEFPGALTAEVDDKPLVIPLITDQDILSEQEKETLVKDMIARKEFRVKQSPSGKNIAEIIVQIPKLAPSTKTNSLWPSGAKTVKSYVEEFAAQEKIPEPLIYAIIDSESAFHPLATSLTPAFGLMQIAPSTTALNASAKKFGEPKLLAPSYLYNSRNNVEIGAIYLSFILNNNLANIQNEKSRLYCSVIAYKTGVDSLAKAFNKKTLDETAQAVNAMAPEEVYEHLLEHLPNDDAKNYLRKTKNKISMYSQ